MVNLELSFNNISIINKDYFKGLRKLKSLLIIDNNLAILPELHWIQNSLRSLWADFNRLQSFDALQINGNFSRLMSVSVGYNMISSLNNDASFMNHMPKLHCLRLYGNNLTYINDFRNDYVGNISLQMNPWHCGPQISWMGEDNNSFERRLTCATPICMRGRSIAAMGEHKAPHNMYLNDLKQYTHQGPLFIRFSLLEFRAWICNHIPWACLER